MKYITTAATVLAFALSAIGQNLPPDFTQTPSCAFQPLLDAVAASGCGNTDVACWCANADWKSTFISGVESGCSATDKTKAYQIIGETCSLNGVDVDFGSDSGETSSSAVASPTSSTVPPASSSADASSSTPTSTEASFSSAPLPSSTAIETSSFTAAPSSLSPSNEQSTSATNSSLESTANPDSSAATSTNGAASTNQATSTSTPSTSGSAPTNVGTTSQPVSTSSAAPVTAGAGPCASPFWARRR